MENNNDTSPGWDTMFQWTHCPYESITAIFIMMEPLKPSHPRAKSTGFAGGCTWTESYGHIFQPNPKPTGDKSDKDKIFGVPAAKNLYRILHSAWGNHGGQNDTFVSCNCIEQDRLGGTRISKHFNLRPLAEAGCLMLNAALTRSEKDTNARNADEQPWHAFTQALLLKLNEDRPNLVLVPLYRYGQFDAEKLYTRGVVVAAPLKHISRYTDDDCDAVARALRNLPQTIQSTSGRREAEASGAGSGQGTSRADTVAPKASTSKGTPPLFRAASSTPKSLQASPRIMRTESAPVASAASTSTPLMPNAPLLTPQERALHTSVVEPFGRLRIKDAPVDTEEQQRNHTKTRDAVQRHLFGAN
ncbi:uncharacterized protein LOC129594969 [Paramacrobiotus metropolitanus]|uniref:uncharacterized protein LOC129594969 n=1 Tax=Paramacrobiotus metropolitanus TaxID=2943436 RepID=UPI002445EAF4|nr:uncharacterized protein LOC129594969 [Paramacrobiotus metropolitanus]XP_055347819.1 uncharacterized protein LOC129594969 [Paramacrobiotus metropolitanus]